MADAWLHASAILGVPSPPPAKKIWGYGGRTLSAPACDLWLRLACSTPKSHDTNLWDGPLAARDALPERVKKPDLLKVIDWDNQGFRYRAELYERVEAKTVSETPAPCLNRDLGQLWWEQMRTSLALLSETDLPAGRHAITDDYARRTVKRYIGEDLPRHISWRTAHGDLHWANVTADAYLLDWENWGAAPRGYDAASLYVFSLLSPALAEKVGVELAHLLKPRHARPALLVVLAQVLQAEHRAPFYKKLGCSVRGELARLGL